jgi:hypothetical protein
MVDVTVTRLWKNDQVTVVPFQAGKNKIQIGSNLLFNEEWELFLGSKAAGA